MQEQLTEEEINKQWSEAKLMSRYAFVDDGKSNVESSGLVLNPFIHTYLNTKGDNCWFIPKPYTIYQMLFLVVRDTLLSFKEIESIKGKNAVQRKQDVLQKLVDKYNPEDYPKIIQDVIKKMLQAGMCKQHPTNLSKIAIVSSEQEVLDNINALLSHYDNTPHEELETPFKEINDNFLTIINNLFEAKSATSKDRLIVGSFIGLFPADLQEILSKVFTKGLNIGIASKSVNDVFKEGVILDLELMKCKKELSIIEKWFSQGKSVYAELKYDGIRGFTSMVNNKAISMKTYNMTPFFLDKLVNIIPQLETIANLSQQDNFFFDFEITNELRQSISGKVNTHLQGKSEEGCDMDWIINVFDVVDLSVFAGTETGTYDERRLRLESMFMNCPEELRKNISIAQRWKINSMEELHELFATVLLDGQEGLVVKCGDGRYELKKSALWVKLKAEKEADLVITDFYYGKKGTKRENLIGGFGCESSDGFISVNVGSGFSDKILKEIDDNKPESYIGKIIEVKYNSVISDKNHNNSLFLPRFKRFRFDKDTANSLSEIVAM